MLLNEIYKDICRRLMLYVYIEFSEFFRINKFFVLSIHEQSFIKNT